VGENIRILKWIIDRINGRAGARQTPYGLVPDVNTFPTEGLDIPRSHLQKLFEVNRGEWQEEVQDINAFLDRFGPHLPYEIRQHCQTMAARLK
jgi:phosphoenolpyruvate carboxykinase (GTP)